MKIKRIISSYIPNKLRFGKLYKKYYEELIKNEEFKSENELNIFKLDKLNDLLKYCDENIIYYNELFKRYNIKLPLKELTEIKKIPFLTKDIIRKNYSKLVNKKIKGKITNTGGSTGEPLKLYKSKESNIKEQVFLDYYMKRLNLKSFKCRKVIIRGEVPKNGISVRYGNELILSSYLISDKTIKQYLKKIEGFNPEILHVYPSSIYLIAKLILKHNLKVNISNLKVIFSSSEIFSYKQKELVSKVFKCNIFDLYGNTENTVHGINLYPNKSYEFNPYYSYIEIIENEIISTSFNDLAMPLIRYKTGDEVEYISNDEFIIKGRIQDYVYGKNGEKYPVVGIIFGQHFSSFNNIENFQIKQEKLGEILFLIENETKLSEEEEKEIVQIISSATKHNLNIKINYINKIERTKRGKYKFLIQNLKVNEEERVL